MNCCKPCDVAASKFQAVLMHFGDVIYSPWFSRCGDYLRATVDLVASRSIGLRVLAMTKNETSTGDGSVVDVSTLIQIASPGRQTAEWNPSTGVGLRELVRYRFSTYIPSPPLSSDPFVVFRMLAPCWFDAVRNPLS
jgi:hypothetical protein